MINEDDIDIFSVAIQHSSNYEYTKFPIVWQVFIGDRIATFDINNYIERFIVLELRQDLEDAIVSLGSKLLVPLNTKYMSTMWKAVRHKFYKILLPIYKFEDERGNVNPRLVVEYMFRRTITNILA